MAEDNSFYLIVLGLLLAFGLFLVVLGALVWKWPGRKKIGALTIILWLAGGILSAIVVRYAALFFYFES